MFQMNPCVDGNPCTSDTCSSPAGVAVCDHAPVAGSCNDNNPCTGGDTCADGSCSGTPSPGTCNDNNACTVDDICTNGTCSGTPGGGTPQVTVTLSPSVLRPANHQLVTIEASVVSTDNCGGHPPVVLTSIVSSEPDDAEGSGDGATRQDIQDAAFGTADFQFRVRAERDSSGDGRIYLVTYTVTGPSGGSASGSASVFVPKDSRPRQPAPARQHARDHDAGEQVAEP